MSRRTSRYLTPKKAAQRLSIALAELPEKPEGWTSQDVRDLRSERPDWLTDARRDFARRNDAAARARDEEERRRKAQLPKETCLCCKEPFPFTIESGGLCDLCNEGEHPTCTECFWRDDQDI